MKKYVVGLLVAVMLIGGGVQVYAQPDGSHDSFTITANVAQTLSIVCYQVGTTTAYGAWALGTKALSTATTMSSAQGVLIHNTSNIPVTLHAQASAGTTWALASSIGSNACVLKLKAYAAAQNSADVASSTPLEQGVGAVIGSISAENTDAYVYGEFTMPSASTTGIPQTINVTITASSEEI